MSSKRAIVAAVAGVFFWAGSTWAAGAYYEDFSNGAPGWQSGSAAGSYSSSDAPYYRRDADQQALYVKQPNKNIDGDDHYYFHPVDYSGGSFVLRFCVYVVANQYDAGFKFGLSTNPKDAWSPKDTSFWAIQYGQSDAGARPHVSGRSLGQSAGGYYVVQDYSKTEGSWWYHEFTYDDANKTAHTLVSSGKVQGGTVIIDNTVPVPGGYSPAMRYLVLSDNRNHDYPSTRSKTYGIAYLDDISFIPTSGPAAPPSPATLPSPAAITDSSQHGRFPAPSPEATKEAFVTACLVAAGVSVVGAFFTGGLLIAIRRQIRNLFWAIPAANFALYAAFLAARKYPGGFAAQFQERDLAYTLFSLALLLTCSVVLASLLAMILYLVRLVQSRTR